MTDAVYGATDLTAPTAPSFGEPSFTDASDHTGSSDHTEAADTEDASESGASGKSSGGSARGLTRAQIRRIAAKAQEVAETEERLRTIAAHLVGSGTGIAELTTAIMSADRGASAPITDLNTIAAADPFDAAIDAMALGRNRLKALWGLLVTLDAATGALPSQDVKAAKETAKQVANLDEIAQAELDAVVALLKKN